jgi:ADP-ribosyl-[dinitrogen reductase] hydrolase
MTKIKLIDRYRGSMVGAAIGDALGFAIEFAANPPIVTDYLPIRKHKYVTDLPAGTWSDDTSMALCLAQSLVSCKSFDMADQLENYQDWMITGFMSATGVAIGTGGTTRASVAAYGDSGNCATISHDKTRLGNGAIMRLQAVPLFFGRLHYDIVAEFCALSSTTTHLHPICQDTCRVLGVLIWRAIKGKSKEKILEPVKGEFTLHPSVEKILSKKEYQQGKPYVNGEGHTVKSLESALWAFDKSESYEHGVLLAVNLGGDTDTIAAIYGQLAGAFYGYQDIPQKWKDGLVKHDLILSTANKLFKNRQKPFKYN